jgi:hypothetical protein
MTIMGLFDFLGKPPTQAQFAQIFIDFARQHGETTALVFVPEHFQIIIGEAGTHRLNLHNVYEEYCRIAKREREALLLKYATNLEMPTIPDDFATARANLMPALRGKAQLAYQHRQLQLQRDIEIPEEVALPFSDDTVILLTYDAGRALATLPDSQLETWGVTREEALAAALDNLRDKSDNCFGDMGQGVLLGEWADTFESSRIMLTDLACRATAGNLGAGTDPVIMIPTRSFFVLTAANNVAGQLHMIEAAHQAIREERRFVSRHMYRVQEGKVVRYHPTDPEVAEQLGILERMTLSGDYAAQVEVLTALHQKQGIAESVESYQLLQNPEDGRMRSYCVWLAGPPCWLPKTDWVGLATLGAEGEPVPGKMVSWEDLSEVLGEQLEALPGFPPFYKTGQFPDQQQLARLPEVLA